MDNRLVRIHFFIEMTWWTSLAPWEFEFPFSGSLISNFLEVDAFVPQTQIVNSRIQGYLAHKTHPST